TRLSLCLCLFVTIRPSASATLFPYTTLFRSDEERYMIGGVLALAERSIKGIMTPRSDVAWIDINDPKEKIREELLAVPHSLYPVDRKSTRLNSSHVKISYAVFCLKKKIYFLQ